MNELMKNELVRIAAVTLIASIIGGYVAGLVGGQSASLGGNGSRFKNGLSTDTTSPSDGEVRTTTLTVTATSTVGSAGNASYWTVGGVEFAAVSEDFTSTSSIPAIIQNPFGTATSSIVQLSCSITKNPFGTIQLDLSTTSNAVGYGSSTPALIAALSVLGSDSDAYITWSPHLVATTSLQTSMVGFVFTDAEYPNGDHPFYLGPSQSITLRVSTTTAGTFPGGYMSGGCLGIFAKP